MKSFRVTTVRTCRAWAGGGSTSRRRANPAFADVITQEQQMTQILRQKEQENEFLRKQAEEAKARSIWLALKAERGATTATLVIPLEEIQLDDKLNFIEEPVEIMDREVKQLKQSHIPIVKVRWNARRGPEFTWERQNLLTWGGCDTLNVMDRSIGIDVHVHLGLKLVKQIQLHLNQITGVPDFLYLSVMSYSDEMMHSDDTTTIFPRYPDTLPYVYTRGYSTLRFSTLPQSLSSYPTSGRTARHPTSSPLSPHLFAAYQKMIAEADLTKRERTLITVPPYGIEVGKSSMSTAATSQGETALTVCMTCLRGQLHTTLEDMDSYPTACVEELSVFIDQMGSEALAAAVVTHAASTQEETNLGSNTSQNKACTYKEFCAVMQGNFRGTEGAVGLTRWFEMLES
ncbi:hypothetical protein Tco_0408095 [Tanacetum coccineum]